MESGKVYKHRFEDVSIELIEKVGSCWNCVVKTNAVVPSLVGRTVNLASWMLVGGNWVSK